MLLYKWGVRCLALLITLNIGSVTAQGDPTDPYPVITPENVAQLQEVQRLGSGFFAPMAAWSPDGSRVAVGGAGGFWLYPSPEQDPEFHPLENVSKVTSILFAPSNDLVFLGDGQTIVAYDLSQNVVRYALEGFQPLTFSHSGDWVAYEVDDGVHIGRMDSGETVYDLSYLDVDGYWSWATESGPEDDYTQINSVIDAWFLPDDMSLIVRWETYYHATWESIESAGYSVWSLAGDQPEVSEAEDLYDFVPYHYPVVSVLPDGRVFAMDDKGTVFTEDDQVVLALDSEWPEAYNYNIEFVIQGWIVALSYIPRTVVPESPLQTGIWDIRTGELISQISTVGTLALSPDGERLLIDTTVYDVASGEVITRLQSNRYRILPGTDRILFLKSDDTLHLLNTADLHDIATLDIARSEMYGANNPAYIISPETNTLLIRTQDMKRWVRINLENGETVAVFETPDVFTEYALYTPDNRYLITQIDQKPKTALALWDVMTGQPAELPPMTQSAFPGLSPNGLLVLWHAECSPGTNYVIFYDMAAAAEVMTFLVDAAPEGTYPPPEISVSPGGTYLLIDDSRALVVWDWKAGEGVMSLDSGLLPAFSPDDKLMAYLSGRANAVEVISVPEGELIWQAEFDYMIDPPQFVTDTILRIEFWWEEVGGPECVDVFTLERGCPPPPPLSPALEAGEMRFFTGGAKTLTVENTTGEELARIALPWDAARLFLSNDQTRLWVQYSDGTLGLWVVVPE